MNILIIGGTGFLGYHSALEALQRGHTVTALGLPPLPQDETFAQKVRLVTLDIEHATEDQLRAGLSGHDALVFAAGVDDRTTPLKPAYPYFHHGNVEVTARILTLARETGIKHAVILGSYFAHFHRTMPQLKLAERHPYIKSRVQQEEMCLALSTPEFDVAVLELPYIFGSMPGRKPLWTPLIQYIKSANPILYMRGGSACISVQTVARAIVGALENNRGAHTYPIGEENLTWTEMLTRLARALGKQIRVITLPTWMLSLASLGIWLSRTLQGKEGGLNMKYFAALQTAQLSIDPVPAETALHFRAEGLEQAFKDTIAAAG